MWLSLKQFQPTAGAGLLNLWITTEVWKFVLKNVVVEGSNNSKFCPIVDFLEDFCTLTASSTYQKNHEESSIGRIIQKILLTFSKSFSGLSSICKTKI